MNGNIPICLIYEPSATTKEEALIYDFIHSVTEEGPDVSYALAWIPRTNSWLTAPVWQFHPDTKKELKEG